MLAIVLIPSATLLIIGLGASGYLVKDGYDAQEWATTMQKTAAPGTAFAAAVEEERRLSLFVLGGDKAAVPDLKKQRAAVDKSLVGLQSLSANLSKLNPDALKEGNAAMQKLFAPLPQIRKGVDAGQAKSLDVYGYYTQLLEAIKLGLQGLAKTAPDTTTAVEESTATVLFSVADAMSRGHALAVGGVRNGGMPADEYLEFSRQVGRYHTDLESAVPVLPKPLQERFGRLASSDAWKKLSQMEVALLLRGPRPSQTEPDNRKLPLSIQEWQAASVEVNDALLDIYDEHHRYAEGFAADTGKETFRNSLIAGGGILLVMIIAAVVAARLSNRVVKRLKRLRADTLELADTRLPRMVRRLRGGEQIDIAREVPSLNYGRDELGQVAEAFNIAQRTAVGAAAQEADIQTGVKAVFLNIAHRSQVVVRRQLEVLDKAERDQEDPDHLELLFQLDHLATRARRNAENLIILGGERPGRQWRNPVPLMEIVRSAIGETEHYRRVHTARLPELLVSGSVVADLIHLLAELVDNATAFSPPDSRVEVRGNTVGKGVVVEVEDQGLGIPRDEREDINAYLQDPPDFGVMALSEEARLGLFVVSQLSARHGINVTLVDSAYGGIRAIVLIRSALIASGPGDSGPSTGPPTGQQNDRASGSRTDLPRPRREMMFDEPSTTAPVPTQSRNEWPDDLDTPEPTVKWSAQQGWPAQTSWPGQAEPPPANGNGRGRGANGDGRGGARRSDDSRPVLPRRRRQANLAPQLASDAAAPEQNVPDEADGAQSAEQARNRMSAFQRGTRKGRSAP